MKTFEFTQVDVFTSQKLEGNPLAVFHSGEGMTSEQMMAIAREMSLSETTFLFPPTLKADAKVRIFTVREELPFAGHPTLGTAFVVAQSHPKQAEIRLEMKVGVIPVKVEKRADGTYFEMRQKDPVFGATYTDSAALAKALGLAVSDLDSRYTPQVVSTGVAFLIVPLRSAHSLERLAPDFKLLGAELQKLNVHNAYFVVTGEGEIETRMFGANFEDPATGSAAGCAAAYLVRYKHRSPDALFTMHQGRFVSRPSVIYAAASLTGDNVTNVRVGGYVVEVLQGRLQL
ncbi:MAG: PhzF family phenazine biosynthesis protein [Acidobacteria bacterium]|nr:PhzF family phenazine biosynthesis protein [Acidobacteriota bacterium]